MLDASRGYLATFSGERRSESKVGFPQTISEAAVAHDPFLGEVTRSESAVLAGLCAMAIENRRDLEKLTRERERLEEENCRLLDATGRSAAGRIFLGGSRSR